MLELSILKIEDPSCIWGRIMRGPGVQVASQEEYDHLKVEMNLFYHDVNLDPQSVKISSLKKGQLCALFSPLLSSWCRAIVQSVYQGQGDGGSRVTCSLADYVEDINVTSDRVHVLMERFLHLPFRVRKFHLADIYPLSLRVSIIDAKAELVPSLHWDSSATRYLYILWQASSQVEAVVCGSHDDRLEIELYLTINHVKICANHDLLAKRFACSKTERESLQKEGRGLPPVFLKGDMFSNPEEFLAVNGFGVKPTQLNGVTHKVSTCLTPDVDQKLAMLPSAADDDIFRGAQEDISEGAQEKLVNHEPVTLKPIQMLNKPCDGVQRIENACTDLSPPSDLDIEEEISGSESSENPGPTLADEVMAELKLFRYLKFVNPDAVGEFKFKVEPSCVSDSGNGPTHSSGEGTEVEQEEGEVVVEEKEVVKEKEERAQPEMPHLQEGHELASPEPVQADTVLSFADDTDGPSVKDWHKEVEKHTQQPRTDEERNAARLMEYLNPGPLHLKEEDNVLVVPVVPKRDGVLLHCSVAVEPWQSVAHSPLSKSFKRYLKGREGPVAEVGLRYCWPHVFRGNDTLLVTHGGQDPLTYLPPLVTYMQNTVDTSSRTRHSGLVAVILCPGWEKVHTVLDLLDTSHAAQDLKPVMVLLGQNQEEAKAFRLPMNCRLLVTTPFTLVRLLEPHCSLFLHLSHLVMDEVDKLYTHAPKEMEEVLKHFRGVMASSPDSQTPQQLIAVGSSWNVRMVGLVTEYMKDATVIITVAQEAALYGGVHQMIHLCLDCEKVPVMLRALDFSPAFPQKTLVITSDIKELEQVYEAVANSSALALRVHEGLTHQFDLVMEHWRKAIGAGTHIILVTTEKCLKALGINDATCVVHYGFPMTPKLFGSRLFCMSGNFRILSDKYRPENERGSSSRVAKSVLLLTDKNSRQVSGVLRYLRRTEALLPPELLRFAQGIQQVKEEQKAHRPLCGYLKSLGFCKDTRDCPDRHILDRAQDDPRHLKTGLVEVVPLYIKSASVYYGRLVSRDDTRFEELAAKMAAHYAAEHLWATAAVEGELYGIQLDDEYQRVRVVSVPEKGDFLFSCATVHFIDEGSTRTVKSHQLLQLPPEFHGLPPQAVEIILCGAKPIDNEVDWDPKATRAISQTIRGKRHQAKVLMCLGNTVWVSSMVRRIPAPLLKTFINKYDVCNEVLGTGMGLANSETEHLSRLQKALEGPLGIVDHSLLLQSENLSGDALGLNKPAAYGMQNGSQEVAAESLAPGLQIPVEPPKIEQHVAEPLSLKAMQAECISGGLGTAAPSGQIDLPLLKHEELNGFSPQSWSSSVSAPCVIDEPVASPKITMKKTLEVNSPLSRQPQVRWFQRQDDVILRVKLTDPMMQTCQFFSDRVVYSAYANGTHYHVVLELQNAISADMCSWSMKCNEPEIRLVKKEPGEWRALLKQKNTLVSYDFDHMEEEEINLADEHRFVGSIADEGSSYVAWKSEGDSDSD